MCHVIARNCKVNADEALLTGLLHCIGSLYLLVRTVAHPQLMESAGALAELTAEWNAPITNSILVNWSFPDDIDQATAQQEDLERKHVGAPDLTDALICAKALARCHLKHACVEEQYAKAPALSKLGLTIDQYLSVIQHAQLQIATMQEALMA